MIAITKRYVKDLCDVVFSNQPGSTETANDLKLRKELELLLSQRRIRSIYQANTDIQHAFQTKEPSPSSNIELQFMDDWWQELMDFDFGDSYSLNLPEPPLSFQEPLALVPEPQAAVSPCADAPAEETTKLPKDIMDAIDSLPSCSFCRDQHIRCDRELPCCGACSRSQRECAYFDPMLAREVPRR